MADTEKCMKCGVLEHIDLLDGKSPDGDENGDFSRIECIACYGPGWCCADSGEDIRKSVAPSLAPHYERYLREQMQRT